MNPTHSPLQVQLNAFLDNRLFQVKNHGLVADFFNTEKTHQNKSRRLPNSDIIMMTPAAFNSKLNNSSVILNNAFVLAIADFAQRVFQMIGNESSMSREFANHLLHNLGHHERRIEMVMHTQSYPSFNITYDMITIALASARIDMDDLRLLSTFAKSNATSPEAYHAYEMMLDTQRLADLAGREAHIPVPAMLLEANNRKGPEAHLYQAAVRLANAPVLSKEANAFAKKTTGANGTTPDMDDGAFQQELMRRISTPKGITELNKILENHHCQIAHPKMNEKELRTTLGYVSHSLNNLAKQTPEKIESLAQLIRNKFGGYIHTQMSVDKIFENLKNLNDRERAKIFERMIQMFVKR